MAMWKYASPKHVWSKWRNPAEIKRMTAPIAAERVDATRRGILKGVALGGAGTVVATSALLGEINAGKAAQGEPIPVGTPLPFTGWGAHDAEEFKHGVEMAAEEINALGGILGRPIEIHFEDTKNMSVDEVVSAFNRLIDNKNVHAIITGYNIGPNNAEYEPVADAGILYLHHNTLLHHHDTVTSNPERYFSCFQTDPAEYWYGAGYIQFISWLRDTGQWKPRNNKIALISGSTPYSIVIVNAMHENAPKYGWEVAYGPEIVKTPTSEWGPVLAKVRESDPAAFANTHFPSQEIAQCQNQFLQAPIDALTYYQFGAISAVFTDVAKENALGTLVATVIGQLQDEIGLKFEKKYREKYGANSTPLVGCESYVSMWHWAMAAALAGGSGEPGNIEQNKKVADRLRNLIYRSVVGTVNMHPEWQAAIPYPDVTNDPSLGMPHLFFQIQEVSPKRALIAPPPYNTGKFMIPAWFKDNGGLPQIGKT
jgi:branched-chain amino acid transport system substrate-binding protein